MTLTVGSLFSGAGDFDLGFERAGMAVRYTAYVITIRGIVYPQMGVKKRDA